MSNASDIAAVASDGAAPDRTAEALTTLTAEEGGIRLSITVNGSNNRLIVREARHEGAADPATKRVLDKLCTLIVGRPLQEAADHGAVYTAAALPDDCAPVQGIRTPHNAGPAFVLAERLVRGVHAAARDQFKIGHRENAWYLRPDRDWLGMDETGQAEAIKPIIAGFLQGHGLAADDIWISHIERATRVTIGFSDGVSYKVKPKLMMDLERLLRRETGSPLELFMDEMKDANKIRRM